MAATTAFPGLDTANPNTIVLRGDLARWHDEAKASGAVKPGHRVMKTTDSPAKVAVSTQAGIRGGPLYIAKEDGYQGNVITTAYADGDVVFYHVAQKGDRLQVRVPANAVAITKQDLLMDNGDGCFIKAGSIGLLYKSVAASTAIANTAAITAYSLSYTIPANTLQAGDILRIRGQGILTATTGTETFVCTVKLGSTAIAVSATIDPADNDIFVFDLDVQIRTIGASGTFVSGGTIFAGTPGVVAGAADAPSGAFVGSTAINTTTTNAITVSQTCSSTGESSRLDMLSVELIRGSAAGNIGGGGAGLVQAEQSVDNSLGASEAFIIVTVI